MLVSPKPLRTLVDKPCGSGGGTSRVRSWGSKAPHPNHLPAWEARMPP